MSVEPGWLSKADAATYIGKSGDTIQRLTATGVLVPRYLDSKPSYRRVDLDDLMETSPTEPRRAS